MQPVDFFEENTTYRNSVGTFDCKCVLEEHGRRYAFGLSYYRVAPRADGAGIPTTFRVTDWPGNFVKVSE